MRKVLAFDSHGNWVDVSEGLTVMTVTDEDYRDAVEELRWRHPQGVKSSRLATPISTAEQFDQDGEVVVITVLDYVSQNDIVLRRVDLP
jgi:hypothetical protein